VQNRSCRNTRLKLAWRPPSLRRQPGRLAERPPNLVANLTKLGRGAVIPLDRRVGDPVDVVVNGRVVARGEVVVVDEATSRFGISLTEVVGASGGDKGT
jgi:flagellar motor switch protein FliN